jgi:hypothetical protein
LRSKRSFKKMAAAVSAYHESELGAGVAQANVLAKVVDLRNVKRLGSRLRIGGG